MSDEIKDGFTRLKELADHAIDNVISDKKSLAIAQIRALIANLEVLESEIDLTH